MVRAACEPFGGVFRNGIGFKMGRPDWICVLRRFCGNGLIVVPYWDCVRFGGWEVDWSSFRLMWNHLGREFQFGT
jgi:hypothetical protein